MQPELAGTLIAALREPKALPLGLAMCYFPDGSIVVEETAARLHAQIVGRAQELTTIERFLADARERFAVLLLEGDAGIGKTTVYRVALRMAEAAGFHVLACRPGASDATLSLAAVADLVDAVPADVWGTLPAPQRRALDVALLRVDPGDEPVDQRAVAAGLRSLVVELAAQQPVLVAVDDVQWLDPASAVILAFVIRRLGPERVGLLATRRLSETARLDLEALAPPDALAREQLGPLSLGALQRVLRETLGLTLPRSTLVRVHATSHGNPLFALEIARVLAERGTIAPGEPLPVPDDVRELVRARVVALPAATRDLLLAAALLAHPTVETLAKASGRSPDADLDPAERAGIAALDGARVAFAHPLHAAAVVATATAAERRRMHLRLADAVQGLEERARHLAVAADDPDEETARILNEGAAVARARGGLHAAAELLEQARALTPPSNVNGARARGIRSAELHLHAGDRGRARMLLQELLDEPLAPSQRAEALRLLAELCISEEDLQESERLLTEALAIDDDPRSSVATQLDLVFVTTTHRMDFAAASELARRALDSLRGSDDRPLLAEALAYSAMVDFLAGHGADLDKIDEAVALEDPNRIALVGMPAGAVAGCLWLYLGRHSEARDQLDMVRKRLTERGDEGDLAQVLLWLSWLETRCGNFAAAERLADETISSAALTDNLSFHRWAIAQRAYVDAHRGQIDDARRRSADAVLPEGRGIVQVGLWIAATVALVELSTGNPEAAWEACRPLTEAIEQFGIGEPVPAFVLPDALEALVALGQLDRAEALIDTFERRGRELDRVWALATGGRCRGLLLAARGDVAGALAALDGALAEHARIDLPFDRARTLLVKGTTERRARRRTRAKQSLEEAATEFERMGAPLWADRARSELARVGGRRSPGEGELTPSERRVVDLAADGLSNKEIAARLVVSVHTVEVHLSHAYEKLGVRSRSQLAGRLSAKP
jgi:DNA-binding CsgD family transcriptional regulator